MDTEGLARALAPLLSDAEGVPNPFRPQAWEKLASSEGLARVLAPLIPEDEVTSFQSSDPFHEPYPRSYVWSSFVGSCVGQLVCSEAAVIATIFHLDRLSSTVHLFNRRRIFVTLLMLCSKLYDDDYWKTTYYAEWCGVDVPHMNALELALMKVLNFDINVPLDRMYDYWQEGKQAQLNVYFENVLPQVVDKPKFIDTFDVIVAEMTTRVEEWRRTMPRSSSPSSSNASGSSVAHTLESATERKSETMSGYILWMQSIRPELLQQNPDVSFSELGKLAGARWKALSADAKKEWNTKAAEKKAANPNYGKRKSSKKSEAKKAKPYDGPKKKKKSDKAKKVVTASA